MGVGDAYRGGCDPVFKIKFEITVFEITVFEITIFEVKLSYLFGYFENAVKKL